MAYEFLCFSFGILISGSIFSADDLFLVFWVVLLCAPKPVYVLDVLPTREKKSQREKFLRIKFHRKQTLFRNFLDFTFKGQRVERNKVERAAWSENG